VCVCALNRPIGQSALLNAENPFQSTFSYVCVSVCVLKCVCVSVYLSVCVFICVFLSNKNLFGRSNEVPRMHQSTKAFYWMDTCTPSHTHTRTHTHTHAHRHLKEE